MDIISSRRALISTTTPWCSVCYAGDHKGNGVQRSTISVFSQNKRRAHRSFDRGSQEASPLQFDFAGLVLNLESDSRLSCAFPKRLKHTTKRNSMKIAGRELQGGAKMTQCRNGPRRSQGAPFAGDWSALTRILQARSS
jgi:hypothetical protein